jgi:hypothetical protein
MTNDRYRFLAFALTLAALVVMFGLACFLAWLGRSVEAIGIGGALSGLLGLLGVLAAGKQQSEELNSNFSQLVEHLGRSVPQEAMGNMQREQVRQGAREGTREGVEEGLDAAGGGGTGGEPLPDYAS